MWRRAVLVVAIAAAAGAGVGLYWFVSRNDGNEGQAKGCDYRAATPLQTRTLMSSSVEQASKIAGFDLLLPRDVPDALTRSPISIVRGLCENQIFEVGVRYDGPEYGFALLETNLSGDLPSGTPVRINGVDGVINMTGSPTPSLLVSWRQGEVTVIAAADRGNALTQEHFLQILESIPD